MTDQKRKHMFVKLLTTVLLCMLYIGVPINTYAAYKTTFMTVNVKKGGSKKNKTITVKTKIKLTVKAKGKTIPARKVKFKSSDKSIASINKKGVIKAKKAGKVIIEIKYKKQSAKIKLKVKKPKNASAKNNIKIKLNKTKLTMLAYYEGMDVNDPEYEKTDFQLIAKVTPRSYYKKDSDIIWKSSDKDIVEVCSGGELFAYKPGKAIITATTKKGNKKAKCVVTVKESQTEKDANLRKTLHLTKEKIIFGRTGKKTDTLKVVDKNGKAPKDGFYVELSNNSNKYKIDVSGNTITVYNQTDSKKTLYGAAEILSVYIGKYNSSNVVPDMRCVITTDGGLNMCDVVYHGNVYKITKNRKEYVDALIKCFPEIFGTFKKKYADKKKSDLAKLTAITDFFQEHKITYGGKRNDPSNCSVWGALDAGKALCSGHSYIAATLCAVMGIPCTTLISYKLDHEWNQVLINGIWVQFDADIDGLNFAKHKADDLRYGNYPFVPRVPPTTLEIGNKILRSNYEFVYYWNNLDKPDGDLIGAGIDIGILDYGKIQEGISEKKVADFFEKRGFKVACYPTN